MCSRSLARYLRRFTVSCFAHMTKAWKIVSSLGTNTSSLASSLATSSGGNIRNSWLRTTSTKCSCKHNKYLLQLMESELELAEINFWNPSYSHIDGIVQDCSNSIAKALELLQSCTKPMHYNHMIIPGLLKKSWRVWVELVATCTKPQQNPIKTQIMCITLRLYFTSLK